MQVLSNAIFDMAFAVVIETLKEKHEKVIKIRDKIEKVLLGTGNIETGGDFNATYGTFRWLEKKAIIN